LTIGVALAYAVPAGLIAIWGDAAPGVCLSPDATWSSPVWLRWEEVKSRPWYHGGSAPLQHVSRHRCAGGARLQSHRRPACV